MEPNVNLEEQYQQSRQPYQGMPMGNQQYEGYHPQKVSQSNNQATWSLWLGIFSIISNVCCCGFGGLIGIIGIILGASALKDKQCSKRINATVGVGLSGISVLITAVLLISIPLSDLDSKLANYTPNVEYNESMEYDTTSNETYNNQDISDNTEILNSNEEYTFIELPKSYEYIIQFSNSNGFNYVCTSSVEVQLYTYNSYDPHSKSYTEYYYAQIPNGEYEIKYVGGDNYLMDPVGYLCSNNFIGYSQKNGQVIDNTGYTIDNVPKEDEEVWYDVDDFDVINRTTVGEGRITIANGDTLVIEDNTKQILLVLFDNNGNNLIELCKIR